MAQLVLTAVGSFFGPVGAFVGSAIGGAIDRRANRPDGPKPGDLSTPKLTYGSEIPRLAGTNITAGYLAWQSTKRAHEETVDTKGSSEQTVGFTYTMDMLIVLGVHDQESVWKGVAITRVWANGQLVYSARLGADSETAAANLVAPWDDLEFADGGTSQTPWAVQQAEMPDAPAYRGRNTARITNLQLGSSTVPPQLKFEVITEGTQTSDVFLLLNFENGAGTAFVDESTREHVMAVENMAITASNPRFGSGSAWNIELDNANAGVNQEVDESWTPADDVCVESRVMFAQDLDQSITLSGVVFDGGYALSLDLIDGVSPNDKWLRLTCFNQTVEGPASSGGYPPEVAIGSWIDGAVVEYDGATQTVRGIIGGSQVLELTYSGTPPAVTEIARVRSMYLSGAVLPANAYATDGVRATTRRRYFVSPTMPDSAPIDDGNIWDIGTVTLGAIVQADSRRCGIPDELIDTSDVDAIVVRGYPSSGGARSALEHLCRLKHVGLVQDSQLRYIERGGSSDATITYDETGAGFESSVEEPIDQDIGSDEEIPRKLALTAVGTNSDGDPVTKTGDRGTGSQQRVSSEETALLLSPEEQQDLAEQLAALARVEGTKFTVPVGEAHARHQPTGVVTLTDRDGITYRTRIVAEDWTLGVHQWNLVLDDVSVYTQAGIASSDREPTINIPAPAVATLYVLDIPLLRLEDDGPGVYVAVTATGRFRGVDIFKSNDDVTYAVSGSRITTRATAGECDSELPAFSGWGWDNSSILTVTLDDGSGGTLSSATKAAIEANRYLNLAAVGVHGRWEVIQFATATLLTGSTYELTGLLRNLFGTEWTSADHEIGDSFVVLQPSGMMRSHGLTSDLGQTRYFKAVPAGRAESSITAQSIVCELQSLLPYAPVDVWNDAGTIRWNRRSRHDGAVGIDPPLGENTERYDVELYDGVTLEDSASGITASSWTPGTDPSGLTVRVYQLSELVGRGLVAEVELS
jgi:hypothetical protein